MAPHRLPRAPVRVAEGTRVAGSAVLVYLASMALQWLPTFAPLMDARTGQGTTFGPSDSDPGNPRDTLACRYPARLQPGDLGVASYSLPCLSWVLIFHRGRAIRVQVIDRGPMRTMRDPRLQRTDLDLTVATAAAIGFTGGPLTWAPLFSTGETP